MDLIGAVDIGGTKIAVGLVTSSGALVASTNFPTRPELSYPASLEEVASTLEALVRANGARLAGIGLGSTGQLLPGGSLRPNNFLPSWGGRRPAADLAARFKLTCAMENDADAAALGEFEWGAGRGRQRFIYITISTGIGGGIILDGRLYRGVDGSHPELGHHVIDAGGPPCFCGARGCWEVLASGSAMARRAREQGGDPALDARRLCDLAEAGDPFAREAVAREAGYLGLGLANLITIFAPDCVALGGGLMRRWGLFRESVEATISANCRLVPWQKTRLCAAQLQQPGLAGAAAVWIKSFGASYVTS